MCIRDRGLADCFAPVITIVGKTWDLHIEKVIKVDRAENLRMIAESVEYLKAVSYTHLDVYKRQVLTGA